MRTDRRMKSLPTRPHRPASPRAMPGIVRAREGHCNQGGVREPRAGRSVARAPLANLQGEYSGGGGEGVDRGAGHGWGDRPASAYARRERDRVGRRAPRVPYLVCYSFVEGERTA
jgi:hypothetical protein